MGTKDNPAAYDCYEKAEPDEPMFVLIARDTLAPDLVRAWAFKHRTVHGRTDKYEEAMECAYQMEEWNKRHGGVPCG